MTAIDEKKATSTNSPCADCSAFLNWNEEELVTKSEKHVVFLSLVAAVKLQPELDISLEAKAVKFLEYVVPFNQESTEAFLNSFASFSGDSSTNFIQSIVVLVSTPNQAIAKAAMKMLEKLFSWCSAKVRLALVKADLMHQLITTLNPLSLSIAEAVDIHIHLLKIITHFIVIFDLNQLQSIMWSLPPLFGYLFTQSKDHTNLQDSRLNEVPQDAQPMNRSLHPPHDTEYLYVADISKFRIQTETVGSLIHTSAFLHAQSPHPDSYLRSELDYPRHQIIPHPPLVDLFHPPTGSYSRIMSESPSSQQGKNGGIPVHGIDSKVFECGTTTLFSFALTETTPSQHRLFGSEVIQRVVGCSVSHSTMTVGRDCCRRIWEVMMYLNNSFSSCIRLSNDEFSISFDELDSKKGQSSLCYGRPEWWTIDASITFASHSIGFNDDEANVAFSVLETIRGVMGVVLVKDDILRLVRAQFGTIGSQIRTAVVSSGSQYSKTSVEQMNELDPIVLGGDGLTATTCSQLSEVSIYSDSGSTADSSLFCGEDTAFFLRLSQGAINMKGSSLTIQTSSFRRNNRCSEEERQLRSQHHSTVADDSETPTDATDEDEVSITTLKAKKKRKMETSWMDELFESTDIQMWSTVPNKKPVEPLAGTPTKHTHSGKSSPRTQSSQSTRSSSPTREELMIMFPEEKTPGPSHRHLVDEPLSCSHPT
ncbi:hypothetical protein BLNAU_1573 [Blattamonas nauphoetae]|uniref:Uncharacterized protein n=1 Tax=Blattamonas nauphoetae TaxID=2049346 RepID=A0ABQ9YIQ4_9EUKA|nr:hypothetical protein BLNAU_1573 [Blattamonas nauphoetae]